MIKEVGPAFRLMVAFTILTGLLYPAAITGVAQFVLPREANGSLLIMNNKVVGSSLIGQNFSKSEYFHPRPSAAGNGYDATASGGSNLGPTNAQLLRTIKERVAQYCIENDSPCDASRPIPADAVTASSSGLDPHISPANAEVQMARVAKARNVPMDEMKRLVTASVERPDLGFLGEPRVNVLLLNIALDQRFPIAGWRK
jgi:K+-transporting ATPase ATPase C chain